MSTSIRINFYGYNTTTTDPTFGQQYKGERGELSSDLLDVNGQFTGVSLLLTSTTISTSGSASLYTSGVDIFPNDVCNYYWTNTAPISLTFSNLPPNSPVTVKGLGGKSNDKTTEWNVNGVTGEHTPLWQDIPADPIKLTGISDGSGVLVVTLTAVGALDYWYLGGMELSYGDADVDADPTTEFNSTLNYTTTLTGVTTATLTDSSGNIMELLNVTDTSADVPDYGVGQRCLTGVTTLILSDGAGIAQAEVVLLPKSTYSVTSLETGFTKNQGDWTYGWDEVTYNPPTVGTEGHWSHSTIVYLGDGSVSGVTEATNVNSFVVDPSDGYMSLQTIVFLTNQPIPVSSAQIENVVPTSWKKGKCPPWLV